MSRAQLKILLVDDDDNFRSVCATFLNELNAQVKEASNGLEALSILSLEKFDVLLTDIKMPQMHGIELLHQVRQKFPDLMVVLMTGFSDIIEAKEAYEIGARAFLHKPFKIEDLESILLPQFGKTHHLISQQEVEQEKIKKRIDENFSKIPIEDFITGSRIHFSIYLRLSDRKIIKIASQGEDVSLPMLKKLKDKGIHYLYILDEDYRKYLAVTAQIGEQLKKTNKVDSARKAKFFQEATKQVFRFGFQKSLNQEVFELAKNNLDAVLNIYSSLQNTASILDDLMNSSDDLFTHSINVSMLSTMLARELGWTSSQKLFLVATAGLFHDIGKSQFSEELLQKLDEDLEPEERKLYETHPEKGAEMIRGLEVFPEGLDQIIIHHHERVDGSGFPNGYGRVKIHPVAKIIGLVDAYYHHLRKERDPIRAFSALCREKASFEAEFVHALEAILLKAQHKRVA